MKEASKAVVRRLADMRYATRFFVGAGIDIGAGSDPVSLYAEQFPLMTGLRVWDMPDGDAQKLASIQDASLDFVHSSHCLEHMVDPMAALARWFGVLKPGGHMVLLFPDEDMYEQGIWPSNKNHDHKWTFAIYKKKSWSPKSLNVIELVARLPDTAELLKLEKLDASYRYNLPPLDQTLTPIGECAIEMVIRKRLPAEIAAGGRLPPQGQLSREQIFALTGLQIAAPKSPATLEQAVAFQHARNFAAAEAIYREILAREPANFDATHLLGVLHRQRGDSAGAVPLLRQAIALMPRNPTAYGNLANALRDLGRHDEAMACGDSAIALQPDNPDTHCQRANLLRDMGRNDEALAGYEAALRIAPTHADALHGRAGTLHAQGRLDEALATYEAALRARPDFADALSNSAVVLRALGRLPEALAAYDKALALRPDFHDAAVNRCVALAGLGQFDEALEGCLRVLAAKPDHVLALNGAGSAAFSLGRHAAARDYYRQALGVQPDFADGHNNLGTVERELGDRAAAAACFGRAIELRPSFAEPYYNRAIVALDGLDTDSAMRDFDACLARDPAHMAAGRGKAMLHLLLGDFKTGWPIYESRWRDPAIAHSLRDLGVPRWTGAADIKGKRILLYAEQGFGDTLQFARYAPLVEALGAKVVLEVQPALKRVLDGRVATIARGETLPAIDFECPLLSVPLALGTDLGSIPSLPAALRVDGERAAAWNKRLGAKRGLRVGFVASGSTTHKNDANRSVPMARFGALMAPGRQLVCLQKDLRDSDKPWLDAHKDVSFFGPELGDFADTAALVAGLDLVVSVDTSIAHLAASLGKPTFVLLPFSPDWRWLLTRADSPWYPTMRLFRQPRVGDWDSAFADLLRTVASTEKQMQP